MQVQTVPEVSRSPYYPALDGLRALAVLLVFLVHTTPALCPWGWLGVQVFFVLSGFLITGILFDSRHTAHRYRNFYSRRALRIFPLYYAVLLLCLLALRLTHGYGPPHLWLWFCYGQNFAWFLPGRHSFSDSLFTGTRHAFGAIGHLWSLALEEQFYLLWPPLVFACRSRKQLMGVCAGLVGVSFALSTLFQLFAPQPWLANGLIYRLLPTQWDGFLLGGLLALFLRSPASSPAGGSTLRRAAGSLATVALGLYAVLLFCFHRHPQLFHAGDAFQYTSAFQSTVGLHLSNAVSLCLLFAVLQPGTWAFRLCRLSPLRALGRVSYGFYVFHPFALVFMRSKPVTHLLHHVLLNDPGLFLLGAGTLTFALAWLSFYGFERRFLVLKDRFTAIAAGRRAAALRPVS